MHKGSIEIFAVIAFTVVASSILAGSYILTSNDLQYKFIGDIQSLKYYNYNCANKISNENMILFNSKESAEKLNFLYSAECP